MKSDRADALNESIRRIQKRTDEYAVFEWDTGFCVIAISLFNELSKKKKDLLLKLSTQRKVKRNGI